jgi:hypothetical protein
MSEGTYAADYYDRQFNSPSAVINEYNRTNEEKQKADYVLSLVNQEKMISDAILSTMGCERVYVDDSIEGLGLGKQAAGWKIGENTHSDWTVDINNTVFTWDAVSQDTVNALGLPAGDYYKTITFNTALASDNSLYVLSENSLTTGTGCTVTGDNNSSYKINGVYGTYTTTDSNGNTVPVNVAWEYKLNADGTANKEGGLANIYLLDQTSSVYQKKEQGAAKPNDGGGAAMPVSQTVAVITETVDYAKASGAGSKITVDTKTGNALILANGTKALAGSSVAVAGADGVNVNIKLGSMTYNGSAWTSSQGFAYAYSGDETAIRKHIQNTIDASFGDHVKSIDIQDGINLSDRVMYGNPYSAADIIGSIGTCTITVAKGYTMDTVKSGGMYSATINDDSTLVLGASFENGRFTLHLNATKDTEATINLTKGFEFDNGAMNATEVFKKGEEISLPSLMYKRLNAHDPQYFEKLSYEYYGGEKMA